MLAEALGGAAHPAVKTLPQTHSAARLSLRHHRLACRRLGFSPASLSSCGATLLSSVSRPHFRRLPSAVRLRAMPSTGVPPDYRARRRKSPACSPRPEAGPAWPRPQPRVEPRPPRKPRPMQTTRARKDQNNVLRFPVRGCLTFLRACSRERWKGRSV